MSQINQFATTGIAGTNTFTGDVGGLVSPIAGNINLYGGNNIQSTGNPATGTLHFDLVGTTEHAVQIGNLAGNLTSLPVMTNGQLIIGQTGADPLVANLAVSNGIAKTEGAGTLAIAGIQSTTAQIGVVTLASDAESIAGTDSSKVIVPTSLKAKLGTQTLHGVAIGASTTAALAWTAAPSAGQILRGTAGDPTWTTATYPADVTKGDVLVATADHIIGVTSGATTAGYVLTANGAATSPTFQAPGTGIFWSREVATPVAIVANHGYVQANAGAGLTTFTLPVAAALGTTIEIIGESSGGWTITQNAGQSIRYGNLSTTIGVGGSLASSNRYDTVILRCRVADTTWSVVSSVGVLNVI